MDGKTAQDHRRKRDFQTQICEATRLKQRIAPWDQVGKIVARHIDPPSIDLFAPPVMHGPDDLVLRLHRFGFPLASPNPKSTLAQDHPCFADLPLPMRALEHLLSATNRLLLVQGRTKDARFIDIGCGGAVPVLCASHYFPKCDGLDFDPAYLKAGRNTVQTAGAPNSEIFLADGLTFEHYDQCDVIYYFRPLRDPAMRIEMENRIFSNARPGTVILAPYDIHLNPRADSAYTRIEKCIFIAGATQDQAGALRADAERTDVDIVKHASFKGMDVGFWKPVLDAASFN